MKVLERVAFLPEKIDYVVPHQANDRSPGGGQRTVSSEKMLSTRETGNTVGIDNLPHQESVGTDQTHDAIMTGFAALNIRRLCTELLIGQ